MSKKMFVPALVAALLSAGVAAAAQDRDHRDDRNAYTQRNDSNGYTQHDDRNGNAQRDDRNGYTQRDDRSGYTQRDDHNGYAQRDDHNGYTQRDDHNGYAQRDDRSGYSQRDDRDRRDERWQNDRRDERRAERQEGGWGRGSDFHSGYDGWGPDHDLRRGERLPSRYRDHVYVVDNWRAHHLNRPPRGQHWVQVGADYVLVAAATGLIVSAVTGQ